MLSRVSSRRRGDRLDCLRLEEKKRAVVPGHGRRQFGSQKAKETGRSCPVAILDAVADVGHEAEGVGEKRCGDRAREAEQTKADDQRIAHRRQPSTQSLDLCLQVIRQRAVQIS